MSARDALPPVYLPQIWTKPLLPAVFAVSAALNGETGKMINFIRKSDDPYILEFGTADVNEICNKEKAVPEEWITKDGSDIGDEFIAYARPLIQGSVEVPMKDGLPYFAFRK